MVSYKKEGMTSPAVSGALYGSQEWRKKKSWTEKTEIPHRPNTSWASTEEGLEQTNADPNNQSYAKNCKQSKSERKVTNRQVMPTPILSTDDEVGLIHVPSTPRCAQVGHASLWIQAGRDLFTTIATA